MQFGKQHAPIPFRSVCVHLFFVDVVEQKREQCNLENSGLLFPFDPFVCILFFLLLLLNRNVNKEKRN
jgi:hypothetical protein